MSNAALREGLCHLCLEYACVSSNHTGEVPVEEYPLAKWVRVCQRCAGKLTIGNRVNGVISRAKGRQR